jgi:hypothetical protein
MLSNFLMNFIVLLLLFFIQQRACTSQLCSWNQSTKAVEYAEGVNINFARPKNVPRPSPSVTPTSSEALSTPPRTPTQPPRSASAPPFVPDSPVGSPPSTPQPNETTPVRPSRASSSTPVHVKVKRVEHRNQEAAGFFARLARCPEKPVVLSLLPEYCDAFEPTSVQLKLPPPLIQLGDELHAQCVNLSFGELLVKADEVFKSLAFTQEQVMTCLL